MRLTAIGTLMLLLQSFFGPTQQREIAKATIEGVVVHAGRGEALPRAQVTLIRATRGGVDGATAVTTQAGTESMPGIPSVTTDNEGKFAFKAVEPGSYRIAVARNGYVRQEYGQRLFSGQGKIVTVTAGQSIREIAVHLVPAGNVNGAVRDPSGEPVAGFQVQLLRSAYGSTGQRTFQSAGGARTNDRGEYRLYWVTPGRYYLAVTSTTPALALTNLGVPVSANEIVERNYPLTFYPGTFEESQASAVEVQPGVELNAIDIFLPEQQLFHVRGRVIELATGLHPQVASVSIVTRGPATPRSVSTGSLPTYNPASGTFELSGVAPGSYWVRATVSANTADSVVTTGAAGRTLTDLFTDSIFLGRQTAQIPVDVSRSDVDGLVLTVSAGVPIQGRLSVEGQSLAAVPNFERLRVTLRPTTGTPTSPARNQPMNPAGAFTLENVLPGEYFVTVQSLPPHYYVKAVRIGETDALNQPMLITGPVSGKLDVVVSPKAARINGIVTDDRQRAASGIQAVLVPDLNWNRVELYKTAVTDETGRFTMQGIPPGDYKIFAWEAIEPFGYFDRDFLRQFEQKGKFVRVVESSTESVEVKLIPAPN